jgi:type IV secretory pathway TrbF-like protein
VVTDKGKHLLNAKVQEHNRANEVGTKIVHVEMQRCLPVSEQSFDLTWRETTYDPQGQPLQSTLYSGLISLVLRAPAHEKELLANPLGIWIDHFSWSAKE